MLVQDTGILSISCFYFQVQQPSGAHFKTYIFNEICAVFTLCHCSSQGTFYSLALHLKVFQKCLLKVA